MATMDHVEVMTEGKEPKELALELVNVPDVPLPAAAVAYAVWLSNDGGYFRLNWRVDGPIGSYDWVGLYDNDTLPDDRYIGGDNWQWANKASSYKTVTPVKSGYQARYLVWDSLSSKYVSVARSTPWP